MVCLYNQVSYNWTEIEASVWGLFLLCNSMGYIKPWQRSQAWLYGQVSNSIMGICAKYNSCIQFCWNYIHVDPWPDIHWQHCHSNVVMLYTWVICYAVTGQWPLCQLANQTMVNHPCSDQLMRIDQNLPCNPCQVKAGNPWSTVGHGILSKQGHS